MITPGIYRWLTSCGLGVGAAKRRALPPRLPDQPFFYPVLNEVYATQIARDWNTKDGGTGYVLRFQLDEGFLGRYAVQTVGASAHQEYWIPADELEEFNRNLVGAIEVIAVYTNADARSCPTGPFRSPSLSLTLFPSPISCGWDRNNLACAGARCRL